MPAFVDVVAQLEGAQQLENIPIFKQMFR